MKRHGTRHGVATALAALFTALWWGLAIGSVLVATLVLTGSWNVGVQIGPNGEPNFVAGREAQMVLPVAFELDASAARVTAANGRNSGTIERASGLIRLAVPDRAWVATAGAGIAVVLVLWILRELAALCRSVRDGQPFAPDNVRRIRRLALALV